MNKAIPASAAAGLMSLALAANANASLVVTHHERLETFELSGHTAPSAGEQKTVRSSATVGATLSFDALGRRYDLELEPNDRLLSDAARNSLRPGVAVYRGKVADASDSWVRIVVADGVPRGVVWTGSELLAIEAPGDSAVEAATPVIYRLKDSYIMPGTMTCGAQSSTSGAAAFGNLLGELAAATALGTGASVEMNLGVIGDFELFQRFNRNAAATEAAILTRLNTVDGIYSEQLAVQLNVAELQIFTTADDPFTDETDAGMLLDELGAYRRATPAQRAQGLTHLHTGRNLDTTTVGIAFVDTLCHRFFGAGLSEGRGGATIAALVAAHEIGHNFGAEHDAEPGSVCEDAPTGFLMEATVNGSDRFSQCSIDTITPRIAAASCITPLPTVDMRIRLGANPSPVLLGTDASLTFTASNSGTETATGVVIDVGLPNNVTFQAASTELGTCTSGAGNVNCTYGTVPGRGERALTITATASAVGNGTLTANVSADEDVNTGNDATTVTLRVDPAVDLVVNAISPVQTDVDATFSANLSFENRSALDASDVELSISLGSGLRADEATWSLGTCTVAARQIDCSADSFPAQSDATLDLTLTGITNGSSTYTVTLTSAEADTNTGDNSVTASVQVGPITMPGGTSSGGGGASAPLFVLFLGVWSLLRGAGCWIRHRY